jgi:hypothetical protein
MLGRTGLVLFFSVFFVTGLVATWFLLLRPLKKVCDARQWPATPCTVLSSEVKSHSDSDGTTYSVHIVYRYTAGGSEHQADRYDFMGGSSSGYNSKAAIVRRYPPGKEAVCYVNPHDPHDAVLEPQFTPMMLIGLFPLLFVAVGAGGLVWAFTNKSLRNPIEGVSPWESRPDWAEGRVVSSNKPAMLVIWVVAILWNLAAWPVALALMNEYLWVLVFPLVGALLLLAAVGQSRRWQRFGETVFEMSARPGAIGGALAGTLRFRQFIRFEGGLKLTLRCLRIESSGDNTTERLLWSDEQTVAADGADAVPVNFYVPPDCVETDVVNRVLWRLEAKGADYSAQFEVPVFKVAQETSVAEKARAAKQATVVAYQRPVDSPIRVEPSWRGGTEFSFPAARNPVVAAFLTIFLIGWSGAIAAMIAFKAPLIFPIVFGLFDLIILAMVFGLWFSASCVTVNRDAVTITRTTLGWRRERVVPVADITGFQTAVGMTAGTTAYYDIKLVRRDDKTDTLASSIKDMREAEWLAAEMACCAGLTRTAR